jgi:hypothetical protein
MNSASSTVSQSCPSLRTLLMASPSIAIDRSKAPCALMIELPAAEMVLHSDGSGILSAGYLRVPYTGLNASFPHIEGRIDLLATLGALPEEIAGDLREHIKGSFDPAPLPFDVDSSSA